MVPLAIAALALMWAAQEWFLEAHRRRYGRWRSTLEPRPVFLPSPDERALLWSAFTHRDPDPRIERIRLTSAALVVLSFVVLFAAFGPRLA